MYRSSSTVNWSKFLIILESFRKKRKTRSHSKSQIFLSFFWRWLWKRDSTLHTMTEELESSTPGPGDQETLTSGRIQGDDQGERKRETSSHNQVSDMKTTDEEEKKDDDSDSGKESVESDESSFHASDYENDSGYDPEKETTELMEMATEYKETGNEFFKQGDLVRACRSYKKGISILKPLHKDNIEDKSIKSLLVTLSNNLSMLCLQQGKPKLALDVASKAVSVDSTNAKAHYRRAMGHKKLGMLKEAKNDLKLAYQCDPSNKTVQKELHSLMKYLQETHQRQKKAAQAVFSFDKKSTSLYDDKLEEERKKKEAEERKKREEEEALAKRKLEWEKDCFQKESKGESPLTYDAWDKDRKKKEKVARKAQKQEERRLQAEEKKQKEEKKKAELAAKKQKKLATKDVEHVDDEDKLTESELAMFRGYKKTRDGKTTSYFTREPSDHEVKLIGDITPQRLNENGEPIGPTGPARLNPINSIKDSEATKGKGKASAWNPGGVTWEEKDASEWATKQLRFRLMESVAEDVDDASREAAVTSVSKLKGEASVALAGGRKRYIFDFHIELDFEIKDDEKVVAAGTILIPDVNSGNCNDFETENCAWKTSPSTDKYEMAIEMRNQLVKAVRVSVLDFVNDFNGHY
jgi:tetratricopeptide (TPR) repeat protein